MSLEMEEEELERFLDNNNGNGVKTTPSAAIANGSSHNGGSGNGSSSGGGGGGYSKRTKFLAVLLAILLAGLVLSGRTDERAVDIDELEDGDVQLKDKKKKKPKPQNVVIGDTPPGTSNIEDTTNGAGGGGGTDDDDDDATVPSKDDTEAKPAAGDEPAKEPAAETETETDTRTAANPSATSSSTTAIDMDRIPKGFRKPAQEYSDTYLPRHKPTWKPDQNAKTWGSWTLVDAKREQRPDLPLRDYPNGDVPRSAFPAGAWQSDEPYLEKFLSEGVALTDRALNAMLAEYGHDRNIVGGDGDDFLFDLTPLNVVYGQKVPYGTKKEPVGNAGWATPSTLQQIRKRLLHSVVTEGTFIFVMGGHSASAGHGNLFPQSYTLQVQQHLEPVLARLGVYHKSHNFGMGGLGTVQNGVAIRNLYGSNIDVLMWDSSMTEKEPPVKDLFARQGLLSGDTVPVLWGTPDGALYEPAGGGAISTGMWGTSTKGIPKTKNVTQVNELPYWARYLECDKEALGLCKGNRYNATCWIPRDDGVEPGVKQGGKPGGQASWHPGNRV